MSIQSLQYANDTLTLDKITIGNPSSSKTNTAFSSDRITITATFKEVSGDTLTIDTIEMDNVFLGVEYYNDTGSENNWTVILSSKGEQKKNPKKYLIRTIIFTDLTVAVTDRNGKTTTYPTFIRSEVHHTSDETCFPVDELEKAIFDAALKEIIKKYALENLNPSKWLPKILPKIPFSP